MDRALKCIKASRIMNITEKKFIFYRLDFKFGWAEQIIGIWHKVKVCVPKENDIES